MNDQSKHMLQMLSHMASVIRPPDYDQIPGTLRPLLANHNLDPPKSWEIAVIAEKWKDSSLLCLGVNRLPVNFVVDKTEQQSRMPLVSGA